MPIIGENAQSMPIESPLRRRRSRLRLKVRSASRLRLKVFSADAAGEPAVGAPDWTRRLPPTAIAALGGLAAAVLGWLVVLIVVLTSWLLAPAGDAGAVIGAASQLWLLAHGGGLRIGPVVWTLTPLGLTAVLVWVVSRAAVWAWRRSTPGDAADLSGRTVRARLSGCATSTLLPLAGAYAGLAVLVTVVTGGGVARAGFTLLGGLGVALVGGVWGLTREGALQLIPLLPPWARALPSAVVTAVGTVVASGAVALAVSLWLHRERVTGIAEGLGTEGGSLLQLFIAQLAFWPNLVIWAGAWTLGAGFRFGTGSVVSPAGTDLGLVPSIPVVGALPNEGVGHWSLLWLLTGVVAGGLAAVTALRRRPQARLEETTGVSALAGLLAAVAYAALAAVSRGDLGSERMTELGPRLPELLLLGGALLGLSALVVGLATGVARQRRGSRRRDGQDELGGTSASTADEQPVDDGEASRRLRDRVEP